ncbi:MAG TPA: NADH-quinone oxidoreductase subunit NuoF, partial [Longimicrobiales bacterium]|nr:NADH-quinone oxidoreductase subunit NuoF [Longimicrobiales bacterium]
GRGRGSSMAYPYRHEKETRVLSEHFGNPDARRLEWWRQQGGYEAFGKALEGGPDAVIDTVKESGLRGRGGAGFPTGVKWSFMPKEPSRPSYLVVNADESEPGAFKDRELLRWTPHLLIEGCLIGAYAIRAAHVYIYIRGEFFEAAQILARAIEEAYAAGLLGQDILGSGVAIDMTLHVGAGAYICGEETGLMNSLEGRRGQPRVKPPFPAAVGAFGMPTTVNNVETLCAVPHIVKNGAAWYRQWGTEKSTGTKLFNMSGHLVRRGNFELPLGFPLKELIYDVCGGIRDGRKLKAVIPGGSSVPILRWDEIDIAMDYESVAQAGTMLGPASVIVMDDRTNLIKQVRRIVDFYAHESCGQCTPCREGTTWMGQIMMRIERGRGRPEDIDTLLELSRNMTGTTICVLSDSCGAPVVSSIQKFPEDYQALIPDWSPAQVAEPAAVA